MRTLLFLYFLLQATIVHSAEPTENRTWTSTSGHKIEAKATKVVDGKVHLLRENSKTVKVPLAKLAEEDQEFLKSHFKVSDEPALSEGSGVAAAEGLPHPTGKVSGPIDAGNGSSYHVYLPKTLKQGRKAPLLFYTNAGGGNAKLIAPLGEYAELFGWVLAISVESKNAAGWDKSKKSCQLALDHILSTLPVDEDRIHYTGNSGGGAMTFVNTETKRAFGVMPNIGYIPGHVTERTTVVYGLGGGNDYNRYLTAYAAHKYKKNGFHRMTPRGHSGAPSDHRGDGMFWMHCKFLEKEKSKHAEETKDFELSVLNWLTKMQKTNPQRAYSNAIFFKEIYEPSGTNAQALASLIEALSAENDNVLYHQGILAIDEFSGKYYAELGEGGGSKFNHSSARAASAAEKLQITYGHIPEINKVLEALKKKTVGR